MDDILPYFRKWMHVLWFRNNFSLAAWEKVTVSVVREFWLRGLKLCTIVLVHTRESSHNLPYQVAWYFLGFLMPCFAFHRGSPCTCHPCSSLTNGTCVISSSYLVHLALCPAPEPWLLRITCLVLSLAHLHLWHSVKLMTYVLFPCFGSLRGSLIISPPLSEWHTTLDHCLLSGALVLGPWFLTIRCDSLYVLNVTIYKQLRKKSSR